MSEAQKLLLRYLLVMEFQKVEWYEPERKQLIIETLELIGLKDDAQELIRCSTILAEKQIDMLDYASKLFGVK